VAAHNPAVTEVSAFFPCYNDADAIGKMVHDVYTTLEKVVDDFEVIVVDDGSADDSVAVLHDLQSSYPRLQVVVHPENRGYGAALLSGFAHATKQWVFYTDGDAQYDPTELSVLWTRMTADADLVNGYKISRADPLHRIIIGRIYHYIVSILFGLQLRDVDCDFRLMRRTIFDRINLEKTSGIICVEMMKKIQDGGFRIVEEPVHHFHRAFGRSQFFNFRRLFRTGRDLLLLWVALVVRREHLRPGVRPLTQTTGDPANRVYPTPPRP